MPLHFAGYSFGGFLAAVLADRATRRGRRLGRVILLDPNTNLTSLALDGPPVAGESPRDMLEQLRVEHALRPLECEIDFVNCRRAFPTPRLRDAEEWALFSKAQVNVYPIETYHTNLIYAPWAGLAAELMARVLAGEAVPANRHRAIGDTGFLDRMETCRRAAWQGHPKAALAGFERLWRPLPTSPPWLIFDLAQLHAHLGNRRGLLTLAARLVGRRERDPLVWVTLARGAEKMKARRLAGLCWQRSVSGSGDSMIGGFRLVMNLALRGRSRSADRIARKMTASLRAVADGHLALAWLAQRRRDHRAAYAHVDAALNRSDIGVNHFVAAAQTVLGPQDPARALTVIDKALVLFPNDPSLISTRATLVDQARALQAGQHPGARVDPAVADRPDRGA